MSDPRGFEFDDEGFQRVIDALSPLLSDPVCGDLARMLTQALETGKRGGIFYVSAEILEKPGKFSTVSNDRGAYDEDVR